MITVAQCNRNTELGADCAQVIPKDGGNLKATAAVSHGIPLDDGTKDGRLLR